MVTFNNRVAVITGAGTGLGRVYALQLAERGVAVVVNDLGGSVDGSGASKRQADSVVAEIRAAGGRAIADYHSVTDPAGAEAMMRSAVDGFGRLDILINNAGILRQDELTKMPVEQYRAQIDVHLIGAMLTTRAALPHMRKGGHGRVVFTSSGSGLVGFGGQAAYGAAKAAMIGLMNCLVLEPGNDGIMFNTLVPTATTRMSKDILPAHLVPFLTPENVAPAVIWMASDECVRTGLTLVAGGGFFARLQMSRSQGAVIDPTLRISAEDYAAAFPRIVEMEGADPYDANMANLDKRLREIGLLTDASLIQA